MRISDHCTRHRITTYLIGPSDLLSQMIEYQICDPNSKHSAIRISIRHNGNINATIIPRTHALLSQLIDLFIHEEHVYWYPTSGAATFRGTKDNQAEFNRLFDMLVDFDNTLLPIKQDLPGLLQECGYHDDQHRGSRRQRNLSM